MTLMPDPLFVVKTERAGLSKTRPRDVHLKTLAPFLGPDLKVDTNNCTVRAINIYLAHTKELRKGRKKNFIAFKPGHTEEIKPATIFSWIAKTARYLCMR